MTKRISAKEAAQRFQQEAQELWEQIDHWMEDHPESTLKEIEQFLRPLRRQLMAKTVALQLLKRGAGATAEPPLCPHCGQPMEPKGVRDKAVVGVELEGELPHAYYYCPSCREGLSPPQPATAAGESPLE